MDMRVYYRKIQEIEQSLTSDAVVVVSLDTPDGGKAGVMTEVSRRNAARGLVEGSVTLATEEQAQQFRDSQAEAKRAAEQMESARRMQVTVVPSGEWQNFKSGNRPARD